MRRKYQLLMIEKIRNNKQLGSIGIFDSGVGGLSILKEIRNLLPHYDYLYLGDNARAPYGTRSFDSVYQYTLEAVTWMFGMGCPLVILACNTASAKALRTIQQKDLAKIASNNRVLGVIRPTTESISQYTKSRHIGILATSGTVKSDSYLIEIARYSPDIQIVQQACPMWVPLIENNEHLSEGGFFFIEKYIRQILLKDDKIDALLLACTHYPLLIPAISSIIPPHIRLISQGTLVAEKLKDYLLRHSDIEQRCLKGNLVRYFTTEDKNDFSEKARLFMDEPVAAQTIQLSRLDNSTGCKD